MPSLRRSGPLLAALSAGLLLAGCGTSALTPHVVSGTSPAPTPPGAGSTPAGTARHVPAFTSIHMTDASHGWGVTATALLRISDGGRTWTNALTVPANTRSAPLSAGFFGASDAWVAVPDSGAITVYRTTDGGQTWEHTSLEISDPEPSVTASPLEQPTDITFIDPSHGWIWVSAGAGMGGEAGTLVATSDGGAHWAPVSVARAPQGTLPAIPYLGIKSGFSFTSTTDGWMTILGTFRAPAALYVTHDGGRTWMQKGLPSSVGNANVVGFSPLAGNETSGFSVLESQHGHLSLSVLPETHNTGSWRLGESLTAHSLGFFLSFADVSHGFATDGNTMFATRDGGATWTSFSPNRSLDGVTQMDFVSPTVGFAIMPRANHGDLLLTTTDGGHTWTAVR